MHLKRPRRTPAALLVVGLLAFSAHAAAPHAAAPGQGPGYKSLSTHGGAGPEDTGHDQKVLRAGGFSPDDHRYDNRGRYYDYFDERRDRHGRYHYDGLYNDLVYAGITAAVASEYARDYGLGGYSSLPPGIRKKLAMGQPLPPGIAKKLSSQRLLDRLPGYPGYEWRIAGTDLVLIAVASMVVADILYDVFD